MAKTLTIWTNLALAAPLADTLRERFAPHRLIFAAAGARINLVEGDPDPACASADVALGQPAVADVLHSTTLQWVHLTSAGYTRYDRDDLRTALRARNAVLTNSSAVYADPCAQHVLAMMLAGHRQLPAALDAQRSGRGWTYRPLRERVRVLTGERTLIVGYGSIGARLAELLAPFHMTVTAVRRKPRGDEAIPTRRLEELNHLIRSADHIVNLLPSGPGTRHTFAAEQFSLMDPRARFYNVGRGDTVDQNALIEALKSNRLAAAFLDVTSPEPLPPEHPLWTAPNCHITPHIAGGRQAEEQALLDHFAENLRRFEASQGLKDRVM